MEVIIKQRSFLKWAGGKFNLAHRIRNKLPAATTLVEPFVGAGNVFLNTNYEKYVLCDSNADLINLYNVLKEHGTKFIDVCHEYFTPEFNTEKQYYLLRDEFNYSTDPFHRSVLFVYLNRHCFNGLCRYNRKGIFNVSYGKYTKPYFPSDEMEAFHEKSQCAMFYHLSFEETFKKYVSDDTVVYCDPPYIPLSATSNFTSYSTDGFSDEDQLALRDCAIDAPCLVIVSNHDTEASRKLYADSEIEGFKIQRNISCNGANRNKANELLAIYHKG